MEEFKDTKRHMLNTAALVDLKAELIRKQDILKKERLQRGFDVEVKSLKLKNDTVKPKGITHSNSKKTIENDKEIEIREEEEKALRHSREMLEQKAKIYDKISQGETQLTEEESELYMVDFNKKSASEGHKYNLNYGNLQSGTENLGDEESSFFKEPNSDWVDFVDQQGKKRTCLKEDLAHYQDSKKETIYRNESSQKEETLDVEPEPIGPIHYQNVRNKEVRAHGVGYFSFSENEDERKKQMEMLKNMRQTTIKQRDLKVKAKEKRSALLKARLDKVRQRKNIEKEEQEKESSDDEQLVSEIPLPDDMPRESNGDEMQSKPFSLRPWDKGKDFSEIKFPIFAISKAKDSSPNYVEKRRGERLGEFAPPDIYSKKQKYSNFKSGGQFQPKSSTETEFDSDFNNCDNINYLEEPNINQPAQDSPSDNINDVGDMVAKQLRMMRNNIFQE